MTKKSKLVKKIQRYNDEYRSGDSSISDQEYDLFIEELRKLDPGHPLLSRGIIEGSSSDMVPLPLRMGSLNKAKTSRELIKWLEKNCKFDTNIVITPKYDGISLLVNGKEAYTRGDGFNGLPRPKHLREIMGKDKLKLGKMVWGEAIIKVNEFKPGEYKNPRNAVAGIFNSPEGYNNSLCKSITFVMYGFEDEINGKNKSECLKHLANSVGNAEKCLVTPYKIYKVEELLAMGPDVLFYTLENLRNEMGGRFATDGLVIEIDDHKLRDKLGRLPNGNPAYAIAYKDQRWDKTYVTRVKRIHYNVSKNRIINPVIEIEPAEIDGVEIRRVTGYNISYLIEHHIAEKSIISIIRSGGVIPKHVKTFSYHTENMTEEIENLQTCPVCGAETKWDKNKVNKICLNPHCEGALISKMVYFFETLGCEGIGEPTVRALYSHNMVTIEQVLLYTQSGYDFKFLGEHRADKLISSLNSNVNVPLALLMNALDIFNGKIAHKTIQTILNSFGSEDNIRKLLELTSIKKIRNFTLKNTKDLKGVGEIKLKHFIKGILRYNRDYKDLPLIKPMILIERRTENTLKICFTGFRDKALQEELQKMGHLVSDNFTKDCNILVAKDPNSSSSKLQRARDLGVRIVNVGELKDIVNI